LANALAVRANTLPRGIGEYNVFRAGAAIGTETYGIVDGPGDTLWIRSSIESHAPGDTSGAVNATYVKIRPELALNPTTFQPLRYHYLGLAYGNLEEATVSFLKGQAYEKGQTVDIASPDKPTPIDHVVPFEGELVMDNLVLSHYYSILARYDFSEGESQAFSAFVPSTGQIQPVVAVDRGPLALQTQSGLIATRLVFVRIGRNAANLWVDDSLRIVRVTLPLQQVEAWLKNYTGRAWTGPNEHAGLVSRPVDIPAQGFALSGVVERPVGNSSVPGLVIVPGLGRRTRDGDVANNPLKTEPYARLSAALARAGYAVLRFDTRGVGKSGGDPDRVTLDDRAADVQAALRTLAKQKGVDKRRLGVVAADVGALGAALAVEHRVELAGAVLLGPPGDPIDSVLAERVRVTPFLPDEKDEALEAVQRLRELLAGSDQWADWEGDRLYLPAYRELQSRDPAEIIARFDCPVLLVVGGQDREIPAPSSMRLADALRARGTAGVEVATYPLLDHNLMPLAQGAPLTDLADASRALDSTAVQALIAWLDAHVARSAKPRG
jgi:pimeloyl-ACP methyl ester carboxylesterase